MIAIRGAITIENDKPELVNAASKELILEMVDKNNLNVEEIVSIVTTCTKDICSAYPGPGIREAGIDVPILCMQEQDVKGSLMHAIRFMVFADIDTKAKHIYLRNAKILRPDYEEK